MEAARQTKGQTMSLDDIDYEVSQILNVVNRMDRKIEDMQREVTAIRKMLEARPPSESKSGGR